MINTKTRGVINGIAILILWFMPFGYVEFMGVEMYQTGEHIGGLSYLLLVVGVAIAVLSWKEQHQLCLIAAGTGLLVSLLLLASFGTSVAWGLGALVGCLISTSVIAYKEMKKAKLQAA